MIRERRVRPPSVRAQQWDPLEPATLVDEPPGRVLSELPALAACLVTIGVHGLLLWYMTRDVGAPQPPFQEQPAAVMIDMAPEIQQAFSQTDAAVGRPMQEAADTPPPPPDPTPDLTPPVDDAPVAAVAPLPPKPPEKPKVEEKQVAKPRKPPVEKRVKAAAQTTAAPRSDQHAARTTASSSGAASSAAVADWKTQVSAVLNRNKRYPSGSSSVGTPLVRMAIAASGAISGVSIVASSGDAAIDGAAVDAIHRSSPLPPPPAGQTSLTFRMVFHR